MPDPGQLAAARMGGAELARRLRDSLRVKVRMGWAESTECLDKLRAGSDLRVISLCALCVGMCMRSSARRLLLVQRGMKLAALTPCWPRKQNSEHGQELARELARYFVFLAQSLREACAFCVLRPTTNYVFPFLT